MGGGLASAQWFIRCALAKGHPERKGAVGDSEEAPFRGWGVGLRVRSGSSAALSQRDIRNARGRWVIMGRVRGRNDPEQCASRQKRTQPLLGVVVGVGACWGSCAHRAVLTRQAPKWWTGRRRGICAPELRGRRGLTSDMRDYRLR